MASSSFEADRQIVNLPPTWFEAGITLEQIRSCFAEAKEEIRIASGFFTIKGWGLIRRYTDGKRVYLLVGIDEPGEERARAFLVKEILHDLATGRDRDRRQSVQDLVEKMESGLLRMVDARATSHHAKLYIVDRSIAIVASANTTGRGFLDQKEAGGLYGPLLIERFIEQYPDSNITSDLIESLHQFIEVQVANYIHKFDEYFAIAKDITQELLDALKRWLELALPWEIYLKTILALEEVTDVKSSYTKTPVSYQQDMIAQTLRQIRQHGGSMLVASTGLGKTVVGVHVAIHLEAEDLIDKVIIICPNAVQSIWRREMRAASIYSEFFNLEILDKKSSDDAYALEDWEEINENINNHRWLLIFDESHKLRKRYPSNFKNKRYREEDKKERKAFTRIKKLVESGNVKVLLLTGSPYATEIDNINTQLLLLPHTNQSHALFPEFVDGHSWRISETDEFINDFPVGSQLTTPHVARYYGQADSKGVYIDFNGIKKYVPELILHSIYVPLPLENDIAQVINEGYFNLNTSHPIYRKNIETQVKTAWGSSPLAIQNALERTVDTPGGEKQFNFGKNQKSEFTRSKSERQEALQPIINQLSQLNYDVDLKLQTLVTLLIKHTNQEKVIIFCERLVTAFYLEEALHRLMPELKIFSTVIKSNQGVVDFDNEYVQKNSKDIEKAIEKFAPIANNAVGRHQKTYNIFIATDAYGVGVNMQDASIVINYDLAWTPIEPIQRAGRILRLWDSQRKVQVYTFIPTLTERSELRYELLNLKQRWQNLMERHGESQKIIDLPVLTDNTVEEIYMPNVASQKVVIESGSFKLDVADDKDVSPFFKHTAKLQLNRHYTQSINNDIISAKLYNGNNPLIYVLLKHNNKYYWPVYEPTSKRLHELTAIKLLDLIQCTQDIEVALVEPTLIEELSDDCISAWCRQHGVDEKEIVRECALYLKPEQEGNAAKEWLIPDKSSNIWMKREEVTTGKY